METGTWRHQTQWGKLTDDELDQVAGQREKLLGLIQQKYGEKRESVEAELNKLLTKLEKSVR